MTKSGKSSPFMILIFCTVFLTVYCQLTVKWRVRQAGAFPIDFRERMVFLLKLLLDPWMATVALAALVAGLCWFAVMTKYELSYAYPFMSLAFVFVLLASGLLFHEGVTLPKVLGLVVVIVGLIIASQG